MCVHLNHSEGHPGQNDSFRSRTWFLSRIALPHHSRQNSRGRKGGRREWVYKAEANSWQGRCGTARAKKGKKEQQWWYGRWEPRGQGSRGHTGYFPGPCIHSTHLAALQLLPDHHLGDGLHQGGWLCSCLSSLTSLGCPSCGPSGLLLRTKRGSLVRQKGRLCWGQAHS